MHGIPMRLAGARRIALTLGAVALLACGGCATSRLRPQLRELGQFAQFAGSIAGAEGDERRIAVLVDDAGAAPVITNYAFANPDGRFLLMGRTGRLRVFAFGDRNLNSVLDAGEAGAWVDVPETESAGATFVVDVGELQLSQATPHPDFALDFSLIGGAGAQARSRRLGEVVTFDDARFEPAMVARGTWEPLRFAQESGLQILFTEPYDAARIPVLFVHGMQGSPRDFRELVGGLDRTHFQAWLYYYPTGLDLIVNSLALKEFVAELRQRLGFERLHLVAHSMGGLVSLSAIDAATREGTDLGVDRFVTLSTPWLGAIGTRGMKTGLAISPTTAPSWLDMLPESGFLERLAAQALPTAIHFSVIFGYSGSNSMVSGADDGSAAVRSMAAWNILRQAEYILPIAADHEGILADGTVKEALALLLAGEAPTPGAAHR